MLKDRTLFLSRASLGFRMRVEPFACRLVRVPEVDAGSIERLISVGLPAPYPKVFLAEVYTVQP